MGQCNRHRNIMKRVIASMKMDVCIDKNPFQGDKV